jgi:hypothetical protein
MKEKDRKMGLLANRYGLLTVLGLGCSFLGTAHGAAAVPAVPAATTVTANTQYIAGANVNNIFPFDANGVLPAAATGGVAVFTNGNEDRLILHDGVLAQVSFESTKEAAGFAPKVKNTDLTAVKTSLSNGGDLNNIFTNNATSDGLVQILNKAAAIHAIEVLHDIIVT